MHRAARPAPGAAGRAALLAAVVLALLTALGVAGAPGGPADTAAVGAASAGSYGDARADDGADYARAVQAGARTVAHAAHPAPLTCAPGTGPHAAPGQARPVAPAPYVSSSEQHTSHDRGRAPPVASGS